MTNTVDKTGMVGAIRQVALQWPDFVAMERHGKRQDQSGLRRRVRDVDPLVFRTLDLKAAREAHMDGVVQQGKTAALHILVQFPTEILEADENGQEAMLLHTVRFVNDFHGGEAVFAARLDRDEQGQHTVDIFAMPTYERTYKDGRTARRAAVSKFTKAEAKRRFGRDDRRAQGSALQDSWFEYLRDEFGLDNVQRPTRKKSLAADRVEPEFASLRREKAKIVSAAEKAKILLDGAEKIAAQVGRILPSPVASLRKLGREIDRLTR